MTGSEWALILGAVGTLITAVTGGAAVIAKVVLDVRRDTRQINRAVNHQDPHEPTLIERVKGLSAQLEDHTTQDERNFAALREAIKEEA